MWTDVIDQKITITDGSCLNRLPATISLIGNREPDQKHGANPEIVIRISLETGFCFPHDLIASLGKPAPKPKPATKPAPTPVRVTIAHPVPADTPQDWADVPAPRTTGWMPRR